jgi:hypothetical protein
MPIEIKDSDGDLGNIIIIRGIVKEKEIVDALKKHLTQDKEKFKKYKYSLSDFTAAKKFEISTQQVEQIAEFCESSSTVNPEAIVAVVSNQDFIYGMARMWEILSGEKTWETMVFRNREEAEAWIKERVKQKYGINDLTFG